jgi:hypothetical protein
MKASVAIGNAASTYARFTELWHEWARVIAVLAAGGSPQITGVAYRSLHGQLVDDCKKHLVNADEKQRNMAQHILDTVQPWVSLESLPTSDRSMLTSLHARCLGIDMALGRPKYYVWTWLIALVLLTVILAAALWRLPSTIPFRFTEVMSLIERHPFVPLAGIVPFVVATIMFLVKRLRIFR